MLAYRLDERRDPAKWNGAGAHESSETNEGAGFKENQFLGDYVCRIKLGSFIKKYPIH